MLKVNNIIWVPAFAGMTVLLMAASVFAKALPGDVALLEAVGTTPVAQTQEKILFTYTIRPGDTLWDISKWVLKNPFLWPELLKYNYISNPNLIFPGDRLIVPSLEVLERIRDARDINEIQTIRQETENHATLEEIRPPVTDGQPIALEQSASLEPQPVSPTTQDMLRLPVAEPEGNTFPSSDLKITGRKNINFNYREYRGGISPNYFSSGFTRQESLNVNVSGQLHNAIKVEGEFYQSDQELENKYALTLSTETMELFLGEYSAEVPDTQFVLADRSLSGGRFTADFKTMGGMGLAGAAKGMTRYERFYGNRTQGPYYLKAAPVVFSSEKISLNKVRLVRGIDYTFDYYTGQVRFLKNSIDEMTLIEVVYESRQTVYARSVYAGRVWGKPLSWLRLAASMAQEQDPANAERVVLPDGNSLTPMGHWVYGSDLQAEIPEFGTLSGEWAVSLYQSDLQAGEKSQGQAGQAQMSGSIGPVGVKSHYQRTTPDFRSLGNAEQGTDLLNYGGSMDWISGGPYTLAGDFTIKDCLLAGIRQHVEQAMGKAEVRPFAWTSIGYQYFQIQERNDAVYPLHLEHVTRRHTGLLEVNQEYWDAGVRGEQERQEGELASRNSAVTSTAALSISSKNLKGMSGSASIEAQRVDAQGTSLTPASLYQVTKAQVTGALTPSERYSLTVDNRWVWDEQYGSTRTLDSKLLVQPWDEIRLDAKYTWETLQSLMGFTYQPVYTQTAAGQLELLPFASWSLRLAPTLRWTSLAQRDQMLNLNRIDLITSKWSMDIPVSHDLEFKRDLYWLADSTDPDLRIQTEQESRSVSYGVHTAFSQVLAGDATVVYEHYYKNNFNLSQNGYDQLSGRHRTFGLGLDSSLQENLRCEGTYTLDLRDQDGTRAQTVTRTAYPITTTGQTTAQYDLLNSYGSQHTRQDTGFLKITAQWTEVFSNYAEGTYNRNEDQSGQLPVIHTAAPGVGAIARWAWLRAEAGVRWATSWGGVETRQEAYNLTLTWNPLDNISIAVRGLHSKSMAPDTMTTEANLNCSVQF